MIEDHNAEDDTLLDETDPVATWKVVCGAVVIFSVLMYVVISFYGEQYR